jgi:hypothetical protein
MSIRSDGATICLDSSNLRRPEPSNRNHTLFVNALIGRQQRGTGNHPMTSR